MNERIALDKEKDEDEKLTRREIEVLKLLAEGLFNKEIAYKLSISEKTVKNHVSNIFKKIGVFDRTQAAVYAIKHNIVEIYWFLEKRFDTWANLYYNYYIVDKKCKCSSEHLHFLITRISIKCFTWNNILYRKDFYG